MKHSDGSEVKPGERYYPEADPDNQPIERLFYLHDGVDAFMNANSLEDLIEYIRDADEETQMVQLKIQVMSNIELAALPEAD